VDWIFLAGRIVFVLLFVLSGAGHWTKRAIGVPFAELMVPWTGVMLVAGGIGVGFGISGDLAALLLIAFLVPTAFLVHRFWGVDAQTAMMQQLFS
jgi:putative oxidoreductase